MSGTDRKGRRRFITRGEAIDLPHYEGPEDLRELTGGELLKSPPPTPPSRRQPPTPPGGRTRRRYERSPGSVSPSMPLTPRRHLSPLSSPVSASRRSHTLPAHTTGATHPSADMHEYGTDHRHGSSSSSSRSRENSVPYKYYPSYSRTRMAELDPTRTPNARGSSRRDSSSSESSIHSSIASLHGDSVPSQDLVTPPRSPRDPPYIRSPVDPGMARSAKSRPRSWCEQQGQGLIHQSSESPTAFPFAASSYENLDKDGSTERILPRASTVGSFNPDVTPGNKPMSHARSFGGHENRDTLSPRPGSGQFNVPKHFSVSKSSSWQPSSRSLGSDVNTSPGRYASDSNVRKFGPDNSFSGMGQLSRDNTLTRVGSTGDSDTSSIASSASLPAFSGSRVGGDSHEVALVSLRPARGERVSRDRSFDSAASEPAYLQPEAEPVEVFQHAPRKAKPFGNRAQTVELSHLQRGYGGHSPLRNVGSIPEHKLWNKPVSTIVGDYNKKSKRDTDQTSINRSDIDTNVSHYSVGDYQSATVPGRFYEPQDSDRRPSLPSQADKVPFYKDQRRKELGASYSDNISPKRSQSFDTMGRKGPLATGPDKDKGKPSFSSASKSQHSSDRLQASVISASSVMSPVVSSATQSVLGVHKPIVSPSVIPSKNVTETVIESHKPRSASTGSKKLAEETVIESHKPRSDSTRSKKLTEETVIESHKPRSDFTGSKKLAEETAIESKKPRPAFTGSKKLAEETVIESHKPRSDSTRSKKLTEETVIESHKPCSDFTGSKKLAEETAIESKKPRPAFTGSKKLAEETVIESYKPRSAFTGSKKLTEAMLGSHKPSKSTFLPTTRVSEAVLGKHKPVSTSLTPPAQSATSESSKEHLHTDSKSTARTDPKSTGAFKPGVPSHPVASISASSILVTLPESTNISDKQSSSTIKQKDTSIDKQEPFTQHQGSESQKISTTGLFKPIKGSVPDKTTNNTTTTSLSEDKSTVNKNSISRPTPIQPKTRSPKLGAKLSVDIKNVKPLSPLLSPTSPVVSVAIDSSVSLMPKPRSPKSPSASSLGSSSGSPRLWTTAASLEKGLVDPENPEITRGISTESIQSAMSVLDDAIAMLSCVSKTPNTSPGVTAISQTTVTTSPGIDLSKSGLMRFSSQSSPIKPLVTSRFASMPITTVSKSAFSPPVMVSSPDAVIPPVSITNTPTVPKCQPQMEVTQLVSSVRTTMSTMQAKSPITDNSLSVKTATSREPSTSPLLIPSTTKSSGLESSRHSQNRVESSGVQTQTKVQNPSGPSLSKIQNPSGPSLSKIQNPSGPSQSKVQNPSGPSLSKSQNPSGPSQTNMQNPTSPNQFSPKVVTLTPKLDDLTKLASELTQIAQGNLDQVGSYLGNQSSPPVNPPADTGPLDQILASMQEENRSIKSNTNLQPSNKTEVQERPKASKTKPEAKQSAKITKSGSSKSDHGFPDADKPLEELELRRKTYHREDSFNRPDSDPDSDPIPLPRDSVILRHRYHIKESSSSDEDTSSSAPTPRLSPRMMRRHKKASSDSSTVGGDHLKKKHLCVPGKASRPGKDLSGSDRTLRSPHGSFYSQGPDPTPHGAPSGTTGELSASTGPYYSVASSGSPPQAPSGELIWSTPPSTPNMPRVAMRGPQGQGHQSSPTEVTSRSQPSQSFMSVQGEEGSYNVHAAAAYRPGSAGIQSEEGVYNVHAAASARPGSAGLPSDSSSVSSRSRRRFRVREPEPIQEGVAVTTRPGKKDKSTVRKSSLNQPGLDGQDPRGHDSDLSSSSSEPAARSRSTISPPAGLHDNTSTHTKAGLFSLGVKPAKKAGIQPSALGTLISQTAMLAPAVAHTHSAPRDTAVQGDDRLSEPQSPPPMDPITQVKAITPIMAPRHDPSAHIPFSQGVPGHVPRTSGPQHTPSDIQEPISPQARSQSAQGHSRPQMSSPPPSVPLMGSQMLAKLPSQGGQVSQPWSGYGPKPGPASAVASSNSSITSQPTAEVRQTKGPGVGTLPKTSSPVVTMATGHTATVVTAATSSLSRTTAPITKDVVAKPIASPKVVKTTTLKPLSETMKGLDSRFHSSQKDSPQAHASHLSKSPQESTQKHVPMISQQQHQVVETVPMPSKQHTALSTNKSQQQKKETLLADKKPSESLKSSKSPSLQSEKLKQGDNKQQSKIDKAPEKQPDQKQERTVAHQQPQASQQQPKASQQQPTTEKQNKAQQESKIQHSKQPATKSDTVSSAPPKPEPDHSRKESQQQQQQQQSRSTPSRPLMYKQKAKISEIKQHPVARAHPPPLLRDGSLISEKTTSGSESDTATISSPRLADKASNKEEGTISKSFNQAERIVPKEKTKSPEAAILPKEGQSVLARKVSVELSQPPVLEPFSGTTQLQRSASMPIHKRGVIRPYITCPEHVDTQLKTIETHFGESNTDVQTVETSSREEPAAAVEDEFQSTESVFEKDLNFQTPPTTPSHSRTDLSSIGEQTDSTLMASSTETEHLLKELDDVPTEVDDRPSSFSSTPPSTPTHPLSPLTVQKAPQSKEETKESLIVKSESFDYSFKDEEASGREASSEDQSDACDDENGEKYLVVKGDAVSDKVAGWQKHFQQQKTNQSQRQAILRERRGLGVWSSTESTSDTLTLLSTISEEHKADKSEQRGEESGGSGTEEAEALVPVAQRIFQMENKIEEEKFTLTRPTSGFTTPRLKVLRPKGSPLRGIFTPHSSRILEPTSPLATDERRLLDKLSHVADIAMVRDTTAEKRKRFQQKRQDDRRRTQPVTLDEIREADSLESVTSFRAEVIRKSSFNVFEKTKESQFDIPLRHEKGQDFFPQHVKVERLKDRRKDTRYKTLPVTQLELNEIPESGTLSFPERTSSGVKTLRQKLEEMERGDSIEDVRDGKGDTPTESKSVSLLKTTAASDIAATSKIQEVKASSVSQRHQEDKVSPRVESQSSPNVKTVAVPTASTVTTTTASVSTVSSKSKGIPSSRLAKLEVSDDELDKLVEINYREIAQRRKTSPTTPDILLDNQTPDYRRQSTGDVSNLKKEPITKPQSVHQTGSGTVTLPSKTVSENQNILSKDQLKPSASQVKQKSKDDNKNATSRSEQTVPSQQLLKSTKTSPRLGRKQQESSATIPSRSSLKPVGSPERKSRTPSTSPTPASRDSLKPVQRSKSHDKDAHEQAAPNIPSQETLRPVSPVAVETSEKSEQDPAWQQLLKPVPSLETDSPGSPRSPSAEQDLSTTDNEGPEDELSKLSVMEKLNLFKNLGSTAGKSVDGDPLLKSKRRFTDRKKRLHRANTMPVTGEELSASQQQAGIDPSKPSESESIGNLTREESESSVTTPGPDTGQCVRRGSASQQITASKSLGCLPQEEISTQDMSRVATDTTDADPASDTNKQEEEEETEEDKLSKLSLAEKVRLFSERKEKDLLVKREPAVVRRKNRRLQSRFKTQSMDEPITSEEVEKASKISPLAMSFIKPPDPDILQGLSFKDQREYMAQWAESTLSDLGSRSGSRPTSMVLESEVKVTDTEVTTKEEDKEDTQQPRGILKPQDAHDALEVRSILKQSPPSSDREVRSILKPEHTPGGALSSDSDADLKPTSILKKDSIPSESESQLPADPDSKPTGILKKDSHGSLHDKSTDSTHSILKKDILHDGDSSHHSILKKDSPPHDIKSEIRGILKKDSSFEAKPETEKSALKRKDSGGLGGSASEEVVMESTGLHGVLKHRDVNSNEKSVEPEKSALKQMSQDTVTSSKAPEKGVLKKTASFELTLEQPVSHNTRSALKKELSFESKTEIEIKSVVKSDPLSEKESKNEQTGTATPLNISKVSSNLTTEIRDTPVSRWSKENEPKTDLTGTKSEKLASSEKRTRNLVKSDDDIKITTKSNDLTPRTGSNLSRSRSARVPGRSGDSSTEDDSSTSSDKMSWIKNDAVARRRLRKLDDRAGNPNRHSMTAELEQKINAKSLHQTKTSENGENTHKPLHKTRSTPEKVIHDVGEVATDPAVVKLREKKSDRPRPHSIAERLSMLQESQADWRSKVEEKDVSKFTVEGKLCKAGLTPGQQDSPYSQRRRLVGTPGKFPLKRESPETSPLVVNGQDDPFVTPNQPLILRVTPEQEEPPKSPKENLSFSPPKSSPNLLSKLSSSSDVTSSETESEPQRPTKVRVPQPDDEGFSEFFTRKSSNELSDEKVMVSVDDFDHVFIESSDILQTTKKIRPQRRIAASRNPLKNLAEREDLQQEYEEVRTDVAERELRRIKREQIAGTAHIAQEALAGLASKENFSKANLRKTDSFTPSTASTSNVPYKDVMLLHVKGRRHCQMRLVEPSAVSINSGDCYILVTTERIFIWQGDFSNVIERNRAAEIAAHIYQKRDMGCKASTEPHVIIEAKQAASSVAKRFWDILGGQKQYQEPGPPEEDELYEMYMAETTKVYRVKGEDLILEDSGYLPTHDILDSKTALVFDFGSELYVWTGKQVPFAERKKALKLAKQHWDHGYDYSDANINPLCPLSLEANGGLPMKSDTRPAWALFGKVNENMETVLFKEKFLDWPDANRVIKIKGQEEETEKSEPQPELKAYDVSKMLPVDTSPISLLLEGSHVGRGQTWVEVHEGLRREYKILTLDVHMYHILEYDNLKLDPPSMGQFHDGDTYVIHWHFMISQTGTRNIRTQETRHSLTGRERHAYFFWQGHSSTITEKGASALMTVELDEERGPQIRVPQGREPPCFLQLFKNRMMIHIGKREDETTNTQGHWRLYLVLNELQQEAYLREVPCKTDSLRSRGSLLLLNVKTGILHIWHGAKSASHTRQRAKDLAKQLEKDCPPEVGLHENTGIIATEVNEGCEKSDFWVAMDTRDRTYHSMLKEPAPQRHSPRIFYMQSVCGEFVAKEILNTARNHDNLCSPFSFTQEDVYGVSQPGLFLVDNHHEVYLWQGWWPEETETMENVRTGSGKGRFNTDRRLALETTLNYCNEKDKDHPPKSFLVYAGLEPEQFTNLFPLWTTNQEARSSNIKEGKTPNQLTPVKELLDKLSRTHYTFSELQERPLPEGVDPLKLESYLDEEEFEQIFKMPKSDFYLLPTWKQNNLKKEVPELF